MGLFSLIILAVVAVFLFHRLRSALGQTPYDPEERMRRRQEETHNQNGIFRREAEDITAEEVKPAEVITLSADHDGRFIKADIADKERVIETLNDIKGRYTEFDLSKFIEGARAAYEMVLEAFSEKRLADVAQYMSPEIYEGYRKLSDEYAGKNYFFRSVITEIESVTITDVNAGRDSARIVVEITAKNITVLQNENEEVLQGDPKAVRKVTDTWTFTRDYDSVSPAWVLVSTAA